MAGMAQHGAIPGGSASIASVALSNIVAQGDLPPTRVNRGSRVWLFTHKSALSRVQCWLVGRDGSSPQTIQDSTCGFCPGGSSLCTWERPIPPSRTQRCDDGGGAGDGARGSGEGAGTVQSPPEPSRSHSGPLLPPGRPPTATGASAGHLSARDISPPPARAGDGTAHRPHTVHRTPPAHRPPAASPLHIRPWRASVVGPRVALATLSPSGRRHPLRIQVRQCPQF